MIQVVLITYGRMIVYLPFDSCHYIKAHSVLINDYREKKKAEISTGLSRDVGVTHNHLDKDERG